MSLAIGFRGNKGFFAMGNVNQEFTTGLPDGESGPKTIDAVTKEYVITI